MFFSLKLFNILSETCDLMDNRPNGLNTIRHFCRDSTGVGFCGQLEEKTVKTVKLEEKDIGEQKRAFVSRPQNSCAAVMPAVRHQLRHQRYYVCPILLRVLVFVMLPRYCLSLADYPAYNAVVGGVVALPCNVTPPSYDDGVSLVLWYRDDTANPIYSVDARTTHLDNAKHFSAADILGNRGVFNITYPMAYMRINPIKATDGGEYRCRVDFRRARTVNRILKLNVIVPVSKVVIYDGAGNRISDIAGPFNEDSSVNLTCDSEGGNPIPQVKWWRGSTLIDESCITTPKGLIRNVIQLPKLSRDDLMMVLTCQASNTNLTVPVSQTIAIDLNLKPKEVRIITPMLNMSAGERVELVCQSSGSRPPAKILWMKGSAQMENSGESTSDDGSVTTNFLTFVPSVEDSGKTLSCSATNPQFPDFRLQDTWTLNVLYAPLLSLILGASIQHQEILEGSDVYFECNIQANPPVTEIGWLYNEQPLSSVSNIGIQVRNNSLLIRNIGAKVHRGKYQCFAVNGEGRGESEVVNLKIQYPPICKSVQKVHYGLAKHEEAKIECEVDANPNEVVFHWAFNNSANENLDVISFITEGKKSVATYTPKVDLDYGRLYCWAQNSAGKQREPCVFFVIEAGPPDPPDNCSVTNITAHSLTVECLPGYSGGLDQMFYLEVFSANPNRIYVNMSSTEYPFFIAHGLPAGNAFRLVLYSTNTKGKSRTIAMSGSTLLAAQWKQDDLEPIVISPLLALLMGIVGALILLAIIIIMIMKFKSENDVNRNSEKIAINSINRSNDNGKSSSKTLNRKLYTMEDNCPDIILSDMIITTKDNNICDGKTKTTCFISDKTSSLIVPPPDSFHDKYDINSYHSPGIDTGPDISSPSPSTSTLTNTTDPLRLLCNIKHNHTINTNNRLTYAEIILPNDNHSEYQTKNIISMNNIGDIDYRRQSPHVMLSAKVERLGSLSLSRSDQTSEDEGSISVITSNTPIMTAINANRNDNKTWVIIDNEGNSFPTVV